MRPQREVLEAQVFDHFMTRVSTEMRLSTAGRTRLEQYLKQSGAQRRELARQTVQLRRRLFEATRDSTSAEAEIDQLLREFAQLREREQELWNRDQAELANQLTPRQRAVFILQWMAFNERIRSIMQGREPPDRR
jgi:Spy/CpxP family protein refolding chaperone